MGIEPTYPAWKAGVLPLNYTCTKLSLYYKALITLSSKKNSPFAPIYFRMYTTVKLILFYGGDIVKC